jgi:hypothetical protein
MKKIKTAILTLFAITSTSWASYKATGATTIVAHIKAPFGLAIEAKSPEASVKDDGNLISVTVPVNTFKTGIGLRDRHMMDAIEEVKYPNVILAVKLADVKKPAIDDTQTGDISGILTFHGISRPVGIHYTTHIDREGHTGVDASFTIDIRDFGVTPPGYGGVEVKPGVKVDVKTSLQDI